MSHHHELKRLQHNVNSNQHLSSQLPNTEAIRESIQQFTISTNNHNSQFLRPVHLFFFMNNNIIVCFVLIF